MDRIVLSKIDFISIREKLCKALGEPELLHQSSPLAYCNTALDVLVATILTQATSDRNALKSWLEFKKVFPEMESVLEKEEAFLEETIRSGGLAKQKAKTIRTVLKRVRERFQKLSLEVPEKDIDLIREMLLSLPGVGPKTATCVLLFGFKLPAFPVDIHVHRIAIRMGWVNSKISPEETEQILSPVIPADLHADLHILFLNLGRRYCRPHNPNCLECPLNNDCKKRY